MVLSVILGARFTFSKIMEFVSRCNADFSAYAKIWGDLGVQITFSRIMEFVKSAKSHFERKK